MIIKFAAASIFGATLCLVGGAVCAATVSESRASTSITDYFGPFLSDSSSGGVATTTFAPNSVARAQIGDIGLKLDASESASGDMTGSAGFREEITVTGGVGDGVLSLAFDVEGSIAVPAGSFADMNWSVQTRSLSDASDARAGMTVDWGDFVGLPSFPDIVFDNEITPVTADDGWFSLYTAGSISARPDFSLPVGPLAETYDNTILLDVLFTYDVPFTISLLMKADVFGEATLDFFNSATLTGVAVSDAQGAPAPAAAVMGVGGGDLRALAAANAGAPITPVPLPPAAWMLGVALAALGLVRRQRA